MSIMAWLRFRWYLSEISVEETTHVRTASVIPLTWTSGCAMQTNASSTSCQVSSDIRTVPGRACVCNLAARLTGLPIFV